MADSRILHCRAGDSEKRRWAHLSVSDLELFPYDIRPRDRFVYVLYQGNKAVYVGRTDDLRRRLTRHQRHIGFTSFKVCRLNDGSQQRWLERKLLFRLQPPINRTIPTRLYGELYGIHRRKAVGCV